jgi:Tol biopolymer transport system component
MILTNWENSIKMLSNSGFLHRPLIFLVIQVSLVSCSLSDHSLESLKSNSTPLFDDVDTTSVPSSIHSALLPPSFTPSSTFDPTQLGGGGGLITFVSEKYGEFNVYTINVATGETLQLSSTDEYIEKPVWAPDGKEIASTGKVFTDNAFYQDQILVVYPHYQKSPQITSNSQNIAPSWSPDSEKMAFLCS